MPKYNKKEFTKLIRPIPKNWPKDKYGIPYVKKSNIDISNLNNGKWLISIGNISLKDEKSNNKIIHCFKYDNVLERYYNNPFKTLEKVSRYYAASTLDFSMHTEMSEAQIIDATFKNRWSGVWLQSNGYLNVIVTVGWVDEDTYDICFSGIEDGCVLMISTLGIDNIECNALFLNGYKEMRRRFPNSKVICVGNKISGMDDDVCFIGYKNSFGNDDKYHVYWQPSIFNWENLEVNPDVL